MAIRRLAVFFAVVVVLAHLSSCPTDGGVSSFDFCGQTYYDPGTAHTALQIAKDFGVMATGCVITVHGTLLERFDKNFYSGNLVQSSGLRIEMTWTPGNDLDICIFDEHGNHLDRLGGDDSAGTLEETVLIGPGRGYISVENWVDRRSDYILVLTVF